MSREVGIAFLVSIFLHGMLFVTVPHRVPVSIAPVLGKRTLSVQLQSFSEEVKVPIQKISAKKIVKKPQQVVKKTEQPIQRRAQEKRQSSSAAQALVKADALLRGREAKAELDYISLILGRIAKEKRYPSRAQRLGLEGKVQIFLKVRASGELELVEISKSSKYSFFDREALRMARVAAPFPEAPPVLRRRTLEISVPIQFVLRSSS